MFDLKLGHESTPLCQLKVKDTSVVVKSGEWVVVDKATGTFVKEAGAYDPATMGEVYQVYGGNDVRFDSIELGVVTACLGKSYLGETDAINKSATIVPGDALTVKDGVLDLAGATPAAGSIVAYALTPNTTGTIQYTRA